MKLILLFLFFPVFTHAKAIQHFMAAYEHNVDTDSSKLDVVTASMASGRSNIFWTYADEAESLSYWKLRGTSSAGESTGGDFSGKSAELIYGYKASPTKFAELTIGYDEQTVDSTDITHSFGTGKILVKSLHMENKLSLNAFVLKDMAYASLDVPAALTDFKRRVLYQMDVQYRLKENWKLQGSARHINFSDDNERDQYLFEALYGISTGWPWIWAGLFYEALENSENIAGYWTPDEFENYGAKFEAAFPVYKKLQANAEIKQYRLKENNADWGDGHTHIVGLQYGERDHANFKISFMDIESTQEGAKWSQDTTRFVYNQSF